MFDHIIRDSTSESSLLSKSELPVWESDWWLWYKGHLHKNLTKFRNNFRHKKATLIYEKLSDQIQTNGSYSAIPKPHAPSPGNLLEMRISTEWEILGQSYKKWVFIKPSRLFHYLLSLITTDLDDTVYRIKGWWDEVMERLNLGSIRKIFYWFK